MRTIKEIMNSTDETKLTVGEATVGTCVITLAVTAAMAAPVGIGYGIYKVYDIAKTKLKKKKTEDNKEETTKEN